MTQLGEWFLSNNPMFNNSNPVASITQAVTSAGIARANPLVPLNRNVAPAPEQICRSNKATVEQFRGGFVALAVRLHRRYDRGYVSNPDFPLREILSLRSNMSLAFNDSDIHDCELGEHKAKLWLNILTLAGVNGVLPSRLTEDILAAKRRGGDSLHEFFDLLNRRFWELLFQSYRIGTRPQYGFHNHFAQSLIQDLAQSYVGLRSTPRIRPATAPPDYQAYLLRYCVHSKRGTGGPGGLAELLSQAIARPVAVSDWTTCKLPAPERYQLRLGSPGVPTLLGGKYILGRRTQVRRFLSMDVAFVATDWPDFCPASGGWAIGALISALHIALADRVVVVAARYKVLVQPLQTARLGQVSCRLGWGACLAGAQTHTSLIQISNIAITNIEKTP